MMPVDYKCFCLIYSFLNNCCIANKQLHRLYDSLYSIAYIAVMDLNIRHTDLKTEL